MKRILNLLAAILFTTAVNAQSDVIDEMFGKYSGRDGFTVVSISSRMFSMLADLDSKNENADNIIHNLKSIRILTVEDSLLNKGLNFFAEISKKLDLTVYEELMNVKQGGNNTRFLIRERGDRISELLVVTGGPGGNSLISIRGNLSMKNISELSRSMDMDELDELEKLEKKAPEK